MLGWGLENNIKKIDWVFKNFILKILVRILIK